MSAGRKTDEKYTFTAEQYGEYKFCFGNLMSLSSTKTVNIATSVTSPRHINVEGPLLYITAFSSSPVMLAYRVRTGTATDDAYFDPLEEVVRQLGSYVEVVKDEQNLMKQRDIVTSNRMPASS
jgi:hypothetical protein